MFLSSSNEDHLLILKDRKIIKIKISICAAFKDHFIEDLYVALYSDENIYLICKSKEYLDVLRRYIKEHYHIEIAFEKKETENLYKAIVVN